MKPSPIPDVMEGDGQQPIGVGRIKPGDGTKVQFGRFHSYIRPVTTFATLSAVHADGPYF